MTAESLPANTATPRGPRVVHAVLWEFTHWARWGLLTMALVTAAGAVLAHYIAPFFASPTPIPEIAQRRQDPAQIIMFAASALMLFYAIFSVITWPMLGGDAHVRRGPDRLFRLPLATWKMALAYMLPGLAFVLVTSTAYGLALARWYALDMPWWVVPSVCILITLLGQAWTMIFAARHPGFGILLIVLGVLIGMRFLVATDATPERFAQTFGPWAALIAAPLAYAVGVAGLRINRRGGLGSISHPLLQRLENVELTTTPAHRFASAAEAQRWYEWRRIGWSLPAGQCVMLFGYLVFIPGLIWLFAGLGDTFNSFFAEWTRSESGMGAAFFITACLGPVIAGMLMLSFDMQHHFGQPGGQRYYYLTRPVTHHFLLRARYHAVLKNVLLGFIPLAAFALGAYFLATPETREHYLDYIRNASHQPAPGQLSAPLIVAGTIAIGLFMWLCCWVIDAFAAFMVAALVFLPALGVTFLVTLNNPERHEGLEANVLVVCALVFAAILVAWLGQIALSALRSHAIAPRHIAIAAGLWVLALATAIAYATPARIRDTFDPQHPEGLAAVGFTLAITLLAGAPIITAPAILHRNRHRK